MQELNKKIIHPEFLAAFQEEYRKAGSVSALLHGLSCLQAQDIVDRCEDHVVRQLNIDNCLEFYSQAEKFNMKDLQRTIVRFINWHFVDLTKQDAFLELTAEQVCQMVSSDVLNTEKEEDVYEALWKWFKHDEDG